MQLDGKTICITGAASGIGRAAALACAQQGARLLLADINVPGGEKTAQQVTAAGGTARFVRTDVTSADAVQAMTAAAVAAYDRLDVMVNNAGVSGELVQRLHEVDDAVFDLLEDALLVQKEARHDAEPLSAIAMSGARACAHQPDPAAAIQADQLLDELAHADRRLDQLTRQLDQRAADRRCRTRAHGVPCRPHYPTTKPHRYEQATSVRPRRVGRAGDCSTQPVVAMGRGTTTPLRCRTSVTPLPLRRGTMPAQPSGFLRPARW